MRCSSVERIGTPGDASFAHLSMFADLQVKESRTIAKFSSSIQSVSTNL